MDEIFKRICQAMDQKGISQRELMAKIGINENNFGSWRRGKTTTYRKYLPQIAEILGVTVDYLANGVKTENDEFLSLYAKAPDYIKEAINVLLKGYSADQQK